MSRKYFIVSTGRTGTKFLAKSLNSINGVKSLHEPSPQMLKESSRLIRFYDNNFRNTKIRNYIPFDKWYGFKFQRTRNKYSKEYEVYVESNCFLWGILDFVKEKFPESRIIHIIRSPQEFIQSALSKGAHFNSWEHAKHFKVICGVYNNEKEQEWENISPFERAAKYWLKCNRTIRDFGPDLQLNFDEIFNTPYEGFKRLLDFIGKTNFEPTELVPSPDKKVNKSKDYLLPPPENWESSWEEICRTVKDEFWGNKQK